MVYRNSTAIKITKPWAWNFIHPWEIFFTSINEGQISNVLSFKDLWVILLTHKKTTTTTDCEHRYVFANAKWSRKGISNIYVFQRVLFTLERADRYHNVHCAPSRHSNEFHTIWTRFQLRFQSKSIIRYLL